MRHFDNAILEHFAVESVHTSSSPKIPFSICLEKDVVSLAVRTDVQGIELFAESLHGLNEISADWHAFSADEQVNQTLGRNRALLDFVAFEVRSIGESLLEFGLSRWLRINCFLFQRLLEITSQFWRMYLSQWSYLWI